MEDNILYMRSPEAVLNKLLASQELMQGPREMQHVGMRDPKCWTTGHSCGTSRSVQQTSTVYYIIVQSLKLDIFFFLPFSFFVEEAFEGASFNPSVSFVSGMASRTIGEGVASAWFTEVEVLAPVEDLSTSRACLAGRPDSHRRGKLDSLSGWVKHDSEGRVKVGDNVGNIFDTDRDTHEVGRNTGRKQFILIQLGVCGRRGVDDEGLGVAFTGFISTFLAHCGQGELDVPTLAKCDASLRLSTTLEVVLASPLTPKQSTPPYASFLRKSFCASACEGCDERPR